MGGTIVKGFRVGWLSLVFSICIFGLVTFASGATVFTDKLEYAPGDTVWITGTAFSSSELVTVQVTHLDTTIKGGAGHDPWTVGASAVGDFITYWVVPIDDNVDETLMVTATGQTSGLVATTTFEDANTILTITTSLPGSLCPGETLQVCANLVQKCSGNTTAPLSGRRILFFINPGNCGANVGQNANDSVLTNASGNACATLIVPTTPGNYTIRVKFRGEPKPSPCPTPGNSACNPTDPNSSKRCVELSSSNDCKPVVVSSTCPPSQCVCILGYPDNSNPPRSQVVFNESEVLRAFSPDGASCATTGGTIKLWYNDEHALTLGVRRVIVKNAGGMTISTTDYPVAPLTTNPGSAFYPAVGTTAVNGDQAGTDVNSCSGFPDLCDRPMWPSLFITDITSNPTSRAGDWQFGGTAIPPHAVFGTWKAAVRTVTPTSVNVTPDPDPAKNNWNLGPGSDTPTGGFGSLVNQGYGAECRWNINDLGLIPGHTYRFQFMVHDGDQNKVGGDVGEGCTTGIIEMNCATNSAPNVTGPADKNVFLCTCNEAKLIVIKPFTFSDVNNNIQSKTTNKGTLSGDSVYYTNSSCNPDTIIVTVTDSCGAFDKDTVIVTKTLNSAPTVTHPPDKSVFLCTCNEAKLIVVKSYTFSDVNNNIQTKTTNKGTLSGDSVYYTNSSCNADTIIVTVTDSCGALAKDTVVVTKTLNSPPNVTGPADKNVSLCTLPATICVGPFTFSDANNNIQSKTTNKGTLSGDSVCYTATTMGPDTIIVTVTDSCGAFDKDTVIVTKTVNTTPALVAPDSTVKLCKKDTVSFVVKATDSDAGDTLTLKDCSSTTLKTGPSPLNYTFKFFATKCSTYTFCFKVSDKCGAVKYDTSVIKVEVDTLAPVVTAPDSTKNICKADTLTFTVSATDPDCGDTITLEKTSGSGTFTTKSGLSPVTQTEKFYADTSGTYQFIFKATDECGKTDYDTAVWVVKIDKKPTFTSCPPNQNASVCNPGIDSLCFTLSASDPDGDTVCINKLSGTGTFSQVCTPSSASKVFCFKPDTSGTYKFVFEAKEKGICAKADTCTFTVTVKVDASPPVVSAPDSTKKLCKADTIKFTVCATDGDVGDSILLEKCNGNGTFPAKKGLSPVCQDFKFYADTCGTYKFCFKATDGCGKVAYDTAVWKVEVDKVDPVVTAPDSTKNICNPETLMVQVCATDPDCGDTLTLEKTSGGGTFATKVGPSPVCQTLKFYADTSGTYKFIFKVTDECGKTDYDTAVCVVKIDKKPTFTSCPPNQNASICNPGVDSLCFTLSATDSNGDTVCLKKLSGTGTFIDVCGVGSVSKNFCFKPTTSGVYTFVFEAKEKGPCGKADTCTFSVTVTVDASTPVVTAPDSVKKLCAPGNLTFQVCATDGDAGDTLTLEKCNGNGSFPTKKGVSPVCQSFTFLADTCGTYVFCFKVTDNCGKVDYDTAVWVVEVDKNPPVVTAPDSNKTICKPETLMVQVCASDNDCGDTITLEKTSGGGTFPTKVGPSPVCQTLKFFADTSGTYKFIFKATDECGKTDYDTAVWVVKVDKAPVCIAPSNGYVTVCTLGAPICRPIMAYDLDGDSLCLNKTCGAGSFSQVCGDSQVVANFCFVPDTAGTYKFCFEAKEKGGCGKADTCMFTVTVQIDASGPIPNAPDSTKRICQADTIAFTVCATDGDFGDSLLLEKCSGNGNFPPKKGVGPVCQVYKFYADTCGTYKFCFKATDQCGKVAYDTAVYKVEVHKNAPIVTAPDGAKSFCGPDTLKFQVCATDVDCTDSVKLEKISGVGTFCVKTGPSPVCCTLKALIDTSGTYKFVFKATDECGKTDLDTAVWTITINQKPIIIAPDTVKYVLCAEGNQVCFNVSANGGNGDSVCIEKISALGNFTKVCGKPAAIGQFCWTPSFSDTSKCFDIIFKATDSCGLMTHDTVKLCIDPPNTATCSSCVAATVGEVIASPSAKVKVPITISTSTTDIGGFSLCLEYDPALLTFINLYRGEFFDQPGPFEGSYMWNYLVWRNNPSTVIHKFKLCIIGIGKMYYYGGICMPAGGQGVLYVEFRLSNNELYRCFRTPVIWERLDPQCIVNAFTDCSGNKVYVPDDTLFYNPRICDSTALWPKQDVEICCDLKDGGVTFKCDVDPIVMGDVNANGFAYEIGDAVLFANYFISGISVFSSDPEIRERQVASSDVNRDGLTLSIADLVFLLRILAGDAQPLGGSKIAPFAQKADVLFDGHLLEINSPVDLGAVLMTFKGKATKLEPIITGVQVKWGISEGETKVLVYGMKKGEKISAGTSELVKIYGDVKLAKVEAAEYYGIPVDVNIVTSFAKPESYILSQNYPNPFNAGTTIRFATPIDGKVSLKIYNVAGQLVREFSEFKNAGYHSITWDGNNSNGQKVSSGVYLYKLQVGEFTEIRKMTLLK